MTHSKLPIYLILLLSVTILFSSCDRGPLYENYQKMKNSTWDRFDNKFFEIPVEDATTKFDITFVVHCNEKFVYDNLPFYVILTTPSGEERMREVTVPVKENGKLILDPESKKSEARIVLWKNINLAAKGKCKLSIENMIPKIQTEGIDEIGIIVARSKE